MTTTYKERINRYRIVRHEELPAEHQAQYRLRGIDPKELWNLIWSFETLEAAEKCLDDCNLHKGSYQTYKLVDHGKEEVIERVEWWY